jgi:Na+/proline symporter
MTRGERLSALLPDEDRLSELEAEDERRRQVAHLQTTRLQMVAEAQRRRARLASWSLVLVALVTLSLVALALLVIMAAAPDRSWALGILLLTLSALLKPLATGLPQLLSLSARR